MRRQRRGRLHRILDGLAKPGRFPGVAAPQCVARETYQAGHLAVGLGLRGTLLGARVPLGLACRGGFGPRMCLGLGLLGGCPLLGLAGPLACLERFLPGNALRLVLGGLPRQFPVMCSDDFPATLDCLLATLLDAALRAQRQRAPARLQRLERRGIERPVLPSGMLLEQFAKLCRFTSGLFGPALLGKQRVAFLPDDLVDRLVLAADPRQQIVQLPGVEDGLSGGLPDPDRRAFRHQPGQHGGVVDTGEHLVQAGRVAAQRCHRQRLRPASVAVAECLEVDRALVDQLRQPFMGGLAHG